MEHDSRWTCRHLACQTKAVNFITRVIVSALAIWLTTVLSSEVVLVTDGSTLGIVISAALVGLILTLVNMIFRPVVKLLSLPLYLLTFGLFSLVVNALMLWLVSFISDSLFTTTGLEVYGGFWSYFWVALLLSLVQVPLNWFAPNNARRRRRPITAGGR